MKTKLRVRLLCAILLVCALLPLAGCKKGASDLKIGVLWEDDTSGESAAWAKYLRSLAKEYGFTVYAADLWSDPAENRTFFDEMGLSRTQIFPVKADATDLPFVHNFFDAVVSTDSYNYFGRDERYLDEKLLPFVKSDGYIYIAIPGMKKDCHEHLPPELLLSWTPEQLSYMRDVTYWRDTVSKCKGAQVLAVAEMESNEDVWADWLRQENEYAIGDRRSMEAGGGRYLNFIKIVLRKK